MALGPLPDIGTLSYNGVQFTALFHTKEDGGPEYAKDRRSTKYHKFNLVAEGAIFYDDIMGIARGAPNTTLDRLMLQLRVKLTQPGKPLLYTSKGFGNLIVNAPGNGNTTYDVAFGPHPQLISFQPMGAGRAALVTWRVSVCIAENMSPLFKGILAFTRADQITTDEKGYTTYEVNGELEVASTYGTAGNPAIPQTDYAYNYLDNLLDPSVPEGFRSSRRDKRFSEDGRVCTFHFTWEELPIGALPIACPDADGEYTFGNTDKGFNRWQHNLSATYSVRKDVTRNSAYCRFINLFRCRVRPPAAPGRITNQVILTSFRVREGLYGGSKVNSFEAGWLLFKPFKQIMRDSSIWRPIPDTNYQLWRLGGGNDIPAPAAVPLPGNRDIMGVKSWITTAANANDPTWSRPTAEDAIIDIGHQNPIPGIQPLTRVLFDRIGDVDEKDHPAFTGLANLQTLVPNTQQAIDNLVLMDLPDPENSWVDYQCELFTELDPGLAIHKPLPQNNDAADTLATLDYQDDNYPENTNDFNVASNSTGSDIVQRMATSSYTLCLRGFAVRCGYPVPIPGIVSFSGQTPTPIKPQRVWRSAQGSIGGIPIFVARWELWYYVSVPPKAKTADPYPQNPSAQVQPDQQEPSSVPYPDGVFGIQVQDEFTRQGTELTAPLRAPG